MSELITLEEAIRIGLIKEGDRVEIKKCHRKDHKSVVLRKSKTGWRSNQTFKREDNLEWVFSRDYQGNPAFFGSATEFSVYLKGEIGALNVKETLNDICELYSNEILGLTAGSIMYQDILYLRENPAGHNIIAGDKKKIWIPMHYISMKNSVSTRVGVYQLYYSRVFEFDLRVKNYVYYKNSKIRPKILIKDAKVLVDIDSFEKDGIWNLIPNV